MEAKTKKRVLKIVAVFAALAVAIPMYGYVLSKYWGWFIVPVFKVEPIGLMQAYGLYLAVHFLIGNKTDGSSKKMSVKKSFMLIPKVLLLSSLFLGFGWIIHLLM